MNPKTLGDAVTLSSTSSSRVFFDNDIVETTEFMAWSAARMPKPTATSAAIAKIETVTLAEVLEFLQNEPPEVVTPTETIASFYVHATVVDVLEHGWKFISCSNCSSKLGKGATSLHCSSCNKINNIGITKYRFEVIDRDREGAEATFVIFNHEGKGLVGRGVMDIPDVNAEGQNEAIPSCVKAIIGRTCKFQIKITIYNYGASRQTFTVTKIYEEKECTEEMAEEDNGAGSEKKAVKKARLSI